MREIGFLIRELKFEFTRLIRLWVTDVKNVNHLARCPVHTFQLHLSCEKIRQFHEKKQIYTMIPCFDSTPGDCISHVKKKSHVHVQFKYEIIFFSCVKIWHFEIARHMWNCNLNAWKGTFHMWCLFVRVVCCLHVSFMNCAKQTCFRVMFSRSMNTFNHWKIVFWFSTESWGQQTLMLEIWV